MFPWIFSKLVRFRHKGKAKVLQVSNVAMKSAFDMVAFDHVKNVSQNSNEQLPCAKEFDVKVDKGSDCVLKPQTVKTKLEVDVHWKQKSTKCSLAPRHSPPVH